MAELSYFSHPELQAYLLKGGKRTEQCKKLGSGAFGVVEEIVIQGTLCAGKMIHETLLDPHAQGVEHVLEKYEQECHIMSSIRHPNIVQFLGLCILTECSKYPILVMERLAMSLEDLLHNHKDRILPLSLKISIFGDTAKGIAYLHERNPQIIHRDVTSRNVLLTLDMHAKIADLGNARMIDPSTVHKTLSQVPGTAAYMPPETIHYRPQYDATIDIFSYSHLSLYTIIQQFPTELLPPTYIDKVSNKLCARSEVERREIYLQKLHEMIGRDHCMTKIIVQGLDNDAEKRPSAVQVLDCLRLQKIQARDFYSQYQGLSTLDMMMMLNGTLELPKAKESPATLTRSQEIKFGVPGTFNLSKTSQTKGFRKGSMTLKKYLLRIVGSGTKLIYSKEEVKGEVCLKDISQVKKYTSSVQDQHGFEIHVKEGKNIAIVKVSTPSKHECDSLVDAIEQMRGSSGDNFSSKEIVSEGSEGITLQENAAYHRLTSCSIVPSQLSDSSNPHSKETEETPLPPYDYITDDRSTLTVKPSDTSTECKSTATNMENNIPIHKASRASSEPRLQVSIATPDDVMKRLSSMFDADQIEHLIGMLKRTLDTRYHSDQQLEAIPSNVSVGEIHQTPEVMSVDHGPSKQGLHFGSSSGVFTCTADEIMSDSEVQVCDQELDEYDDIIIPKVVVESYEEPIHSRTQSEPPAVQDIREQTNSTRNQKYKLAKLINHSEVLSSTSLLITDDSQSTENQEHERPDWAKAKRTTIKDLPGKDTYLLVQNQNLFIQRSSLQNLERIGEGHFGHVYKGTMIQAGGRKMAVAVKTVKKYESVQENSSFLCEMTIMSKLRHPNIIHLYGIVEQSDSPWLVMEYVPKGDLKNYLIKNQQSLQQLYKYMIDVAMGMYFIEKNSLVHRDLAARNIMVDDRDTCKVADLGLLREIPEGDGVYQSTTERPWPVRWMAPESLENKEFSPASDVWSYGVLLWEMYNPTELPYSNLNSIQCISKILCGQHPSIPEEYPSTV